MRYHAPDTRVYVASTGLTRGQWQCVEMKEKLSTIGGSDGERQIYLNLYLALLLMMGTSALGWRFRPKISPDRGS